MSSWSIKREQGICWLSIDLQDSGQNVLSTTVLTELEQVLDDMDRQPPEALVICSGKSSGFIAGADIGEFSKVETTRQAEQFVGLAHRLFSRIENYPFATVAMINGHCLGGGLELALACDYRVCCNDPSIRIGLPEVQLGIHPGFGGTVRLIETCGVVAAMDMMLGGRSINPRRARNMQLVDLAVPPRQLVRATLYQLRLRPPRSRASGWKRCLGFTPLRQVFAGLLQRKVGQHANPSHYPAPYALIDLWRRNGGDRRQMMVAEQQSVVQLVSTSTSRNLVKVFYLQESLKSLGKSVAGDGLARLHVVGAGVMGGDIAAWCALQGLHVTIQDKQPEALARANARASELFQRKLRDPRLVRLAMDRFQPDPAGNGVADADVIIEAIFEDIEAKSALFSELESRARPDALLATNTSSIPLESLCQSLTNPARLVGLHFFNPVAKMRLVEIVAGEQSAQPHIEQAMAFAATIRRLPLPVTSSPGFLVNRVLMPYLTEAVELLKEGIPATLIDKAAITFGMPMGPVELADTVGLDVCRHVAENLASKFGNEVPELLVQKTEAGQLGRKSGEGFYQWNKGKPVKKTDDHGVKTVPDLTERLLFRYLNEAVSCIHEEIVETARMADGGLVFGTGFAPFRGGPVNYIVDQGQAHMLAQLEELRHRHGDRFAPDPGWYSLDLEALLNT